MNILLMGNGFDLAHGLPTSYQNFLDFCGKVEKLDRNNCFSIGTDQELAEALKLQEQGLVDVILRNKEPRRSGRNLYPTGWLYILWDLIHENAWYYHFRQCPTYVGENWIDFESEISRVVQTLHKAREHILQGGQIQYEEELDSIGREQGQLLNAFFKAGRITSDALLDVQAVDKLIVRLEKDLIRLTYALELYIAEYVNSIELSQEKTIKEIRRLQPTHVLTFNYSDTYERLYGVWLYQPRREILYCHIHGEADKFSNIDSCNLVLGIDEYLEEARRDREVEFIAFKKYYQRIYKGSDSNYLDWVEAIQASPKEQHNLYIFGHSLDVTDGDVLRKLILNDNVTTTVFYHQKHRGDKSVLGRLIRNLVKVIGHDELIRRTGGESRTIQFIPQEIAAVPKKPEAKAAAPV